MPRLLLLMTTTTYKAEAFLRAARSLGVDVVVGTEREQAMAALHRDGNWTLPFADLDEAELLVRQAGRDTPIAAVLATDDDGALLAAHLAAALGLRHNPVASVRTARDKAATRAALQAARLPVPGFRCVHADADPAALAATLGYPCVLKPLDLSGSQGVMRADDPAGFVVAFRRLQRLLERVGRSAPRVLIEDFIPGLEVALEGLLDDGRLRVLALFDKPDPLDGPFFEETLYVTPSRHPAAVQEACIDAVQRAVAALGLLHGPIHAEVRHGARGTYLLEVAPRSIGGLCSRALRFGATGSMALEELVLRHALGEDTRDVERERAAAGVMMLPIPRPGILRRVGGTEAAQRVEHVEELRLTVPLGQYLEPPPEGGRYLGFLFARAATPAAVEAALRAAHARLEVDIETQKAQDGAAPPVGSRISVEGEA